MNQPFYFLAGLGFLCGLLLALMLPGQGVQATEEAANPAAVSDISDGEPPAPAAHPVTAVSQHPVPEADGSAVAVGKGDDTAMDGEEMRGLAAQAPAFVAAASVPIVVELYSSQACVFCPRADRLFADLVRQPGIIGLACHVDYFDVTEGSLSRPFCSERQKWYVDRLGTGPHYTPQLVMQGGIDVVGYRMADVVAGLEKAAMLERLGLEISPLAAQKEIFAVSLPEGAGSLAADSKVWLALYDKPHRLTIAEGRNKGKRMTYANIVSRLEPLPTWEGQVTTISLGGRAAGHAGFAVLVQDPASGRVLAAGQYQFAQPKPAAQSVQPVQETEKAVP